MKGTLKPKRNLLVEDRRCGRHNKLSFPEFARLIGFRHFSNQLVVSVKPADLWDSRGR